MVILKWMLKKRMGVCGLDSFGSGEEPWWALLVMVMNFWVP
jgi:hypothetical protein